MLDENGLGLSSTGSALAAPYLSTTGFDRGEESARRLWAETAEGLQLVGGEQGRRHLFHARNGFSTVTAPYFCPWFRSSVSTVPRRLRRRPAPGRPRTKSSNAPRWHGPKRLLN